MKKVTLLAKTIALVLTVATSVSIQAAELVKVDTLNNTVLTTNISTELAQTFKTMSPLTLNIEKSAETILIAKNEQQFNVIELESITLIAAE